MSLNFMTKNMTPMQSVAAPKVVQTETSNETVIAGKTIEVPKIIPETTPGSANLTTTEGMVNTYLSHKKYLDAIDNKSIMAEMETIRKTLLAIAQEEGDEKKPYVFTSELGQIVFSPVTETTTVKSATELIEHVYTNYGPQVLESIVKFGITELKKTLSVVELNKFTEQKKGSRTLKSATYA